MKYADRVNVSNIVFMPKARTAQHLAPRYAFVRNASMELNDREVHSAPHARYDIVDNGAGSEQVLAYGVRYNNAMLIVSALNMLSEAERVGKMVGEHEQEALPPNHAAE
jgi:hypothetical protein